MTQHDIQLPRADGTSRLSSAGPPVRVEHVSQRFGNVEVLKDVSFELERGKIYSIMGPSGCGKSTLLKIMIGAEAPTSGKVFLDGIDMWNAEERQLAQARKKFGVLFQSSALLNGLTCGDNVALPLRKHTDLPESTIDIMVRMKLELVGMGHAIDRKPFEISGGMKKRCAMARAIALDPAIVFYDEPSAGIDPVMIAVLDRLVMDLSEKLGITSVVITHEIPSAFRISDEILMLWDGRIHFHGTPDDMRRSRDPAVRQFIHGEADGPLSNLGSRRGISSRILGLPVEENNTVVMKATQKLKQTEKNIEDRRTLRFTQTHDAIVGLQDDTRARRTGRIEKVDGKVEDDSVES